MKQIIQFASWVWELFVLFESRIIYLINPGQNDGSVNHNWQWSHIVIILKFLFFSVALTGMDIGTDILTAKDHFDKGNVWWGYFTIAPIFAPFLAKAFLSLIRLYNCFKNDQNSSADHNARLSIWKQQFPDLFWHIPPLQTIR